jgi:Aldehyde dehydrogenase family
MTAELFTAKHPFLDGKPKRMFIDGKWVEAASGKTFETINPSTGVVLARVAEGDKEDIDRAVDAARRAFNGPWNKFKPYERQTLLLKLADLVEKHFDELAALDTLDMGAPITRTKNNRLRSLGMLRYYAGQATAIHVDGCEFRPFCNSLYYMRQLDFPMSDAHARHQATSDGQYDRKSSDDADSRSTLRARVHRIYLSAPVDAQAGAEV